MVPLDHNIKNILLYELLSTGVCFIRVIEYSNSTTLFDSSHNN